VGARSSEFMAPAVEDIEDLLRQRHQRVGRDDDFTVTTAAAALAAAQSSTRTVALLLGSVAAISLIIGGINIMNIMLVCVTERTSETGLRLAIGAPPRDIQRQFLVEAAGLSTASGLADIALGSASSVAHRQNVRMARSHTAYDYCSCYPSPRSLWRHLRLVPCATCGHPPAGSSASPRMSTLI
jgi:hypothetical protein